MPRETITLRCTGKHWRAESAAKVLSWLAYPVTKEKQKESHKTLRSEFQLYAAFTYFRGLAMDDPDWAAQPQELPPHLLFLDAKKIRGVFNRVENEIVNKRLYAGDMLGQLISRYVLEEGPLSELTLQKKVQIQHFSENGEVEGLTAPKGTQLKLKTFVEVDDHYRAATKMGRIKGDQLRKTSLNMLCASLAKRLPPPPERKGVTDGEWHEKKVMEQIWIPSKPVAHLACSLLLYIINECGNALPTMEALLEGNWLEFVLLNAEVERQQAIKSESIKINEAETVQLLFAEGGGKIPSTSTLLEQF